MSETFYIKKTAFDDNNFDLTQREADSFIIGPGELNGPGGLAQDSDLELYGFGAIKWGEGVNQNQYRMLESNACPEKVAGDFLVGTDDPNGFVPGTGSFVPNAGSPINGAVPKDMYDLGIGNGITAPLIGQLWYNTTQSILYNNEPAGWTTVFQEATNDLTAHINDGTVHLRGGQDVFLDGLLLGGSPLSLQSDDVNRLIGMGSISGETTVQRQLDLMVLRSGDTMTGNLTINTANASILLRPTASSNIPQFIIADDNGIERADFKFGVSTGDVSIIRRNSVGAIETSLILNGDGNASLVGGANLPTLPAHLTRKDYTDTKAPINSPTLTGDPRSVTFSASDNSTRIATTAFVQSQADKNGKTIFSGSSGSTTVPAGISKVEVVIIGGGGGGASGGDGGNWPGGDGGNGGTSSVTIPGNGTYSVSGGVGGRGGQNPPTVVSADDTRRIIGNGRGVSNPGTYGAYGNYGRGGNGGMSELGIGGVGNTTSSNAQSGTNGGAGAGGRGQDNASGEGGASGHLFRGVWNVSGGATLSWTIGAGGARGVPPFNFVLDRFGGYGGAGYIIIRWAN